MRKLEKYELIEKLSEKLNMSKVKIIKVLEN